MNSEFSIESLLLVKKAFQGRDVSILLHGICYMTLNEPSTWQNSGVALTIPKPDGMPPHDCSTFKVHKLSSSGTEISDTRITSRIGIGRDSD